ncbi:unnamed protein product [Trichogramma brassicae]|uniref:Endonuclease/exonuclease/phosphatase domain-containing protein n=1 Tax=Trichogramma brassicae TaxID=86971 RepID=A0A6H5I8U4_9HYME|nr:unnamed protein product [Trichogramma brassicae]
MDHLDHVLGALSSKSLIVGLDANGVSPMWSARVQVPDARGLLLEEVIVGHGLQPLNKPGCLPTIKTGERDIDVSLATSDLARLSEWTVLDDWTSSDHRTLLITVISTNASIQSGLTRFNLRRLKWPKYKENIERLLTDLDPSQELESRVDMESYAEKLGSLLAEAANGAIPVKRRFGRSVPWWNNDLTYLKKEVKRHRRTYQRERSQEAREVSGSRYLTLRKRYSSAAFKARTDSWRNFAEESTRSNTYGVVYKLLNQRMSPVVAVSTIYTGDTHTDSWDSTASAMLDGLFRGPDGSEVTDPVGCQMLGENIHDWSAAQIKKAVKSLKHGKCPEQMYQKIQVGLIWKGLTSSTYGKLGLLEEQRLERERERALREKMARGQSPYVLAATTVSTRDSVTIRSRSDSWDGVSSNPFSTIEYIEGSGKRTIPLSDLRLPDWHKNKKGRTIDDKSVQEYVGKNGTGDGRDDVTTVDEKGREDSSEEEEEVEEIAVEENGEGGGHDKVYSDDRKTQQVMLANARKKEERLRKKELGKAKRHEDYLASMHSISHDLAHYMALEASKIPKMAAA